MLLIHSVVKASSFTQLHFVFSQRDLKSKKSSKDPVVTKLHADITSKGSHFQALGGDVVVKFEDDEMVSMSYDLHDMPESCKSEECYMIIHEGYGCGDIDAKYMKTEWVKNDDGKWEKEEDSMGEEKTGFTTNEDGFAAGTIFGVDNGNEHDDNKGKFMIIYGPNPDAEDNDDDRRQLKSKKGEDDVIKIGCSKLMSV